ncbi:MAG: hypothetical protein OD815_001699 [Candidatus Alkanophagales archaeon MCA70_species_2]|nr:hypothetical protein [Candidatus Alkanophaga liquidiphilum]
MLIIIKLKPGVGVGDVGVSEGDSGGVVAADGVPAVVGDIGVSVVVGISVGVGKGTVGVVVVVVVGDSVGEVVGVGERLGDGVGDCVGDGGGVATSVKLTSINGYFKTAELIVKLVSA